MECELEAGGSGDPLDVRDDDVDFICPEAVIVALPIMFIENESVAERDFRLPVAHRRLARHTVELRRGIECRQCR